MGVSEGHTEIIICKSLLPEPEPTFWAKNSNGEREIIIILPIKIMPRICKQPQQSAYVRKWEAKFKELEKYKAENGHCDVPRSHLELGNWVNTQRTAYKKYLSEERINRLNEIGFSWEVHNDGWEAKFKELKKYKEENGHCNVPQRHPGLGNRANNQRHLFRKGNRLDNRIKRLQDIGFQWVVPRGPRPRARPVSDNEDNPSSDESDAEAGDVQSKRAGSTEGSPGSRRKKSKLSVSSQPHLTDASDEQFTGVGGENNVGNVMPREAHELVTEVNRLETSEGEKEDSSAEDDNGGSEFYTGEDPSFQVPRMIGLLTSGQDQVSLHNRVHPGSGEDQYAIANHHGMEQENIIGDTTGGENHTTTFDWGIVVSRPLVCLPIFFAVWSFTRITVNEYYVPRSPVNNGNFSSVSDESLLLNSEQLTSSQCLVVENDSVYCTRGGVEDHNMEGRFAQLLSTS